MFKGIIFKIDIKQAYMDIKLDRRMVGNFIDLIQFRLKMIYSISIVSRYMKQPQYLIC